MEMIKFYQFLGWVPLNDPEVKTMKHHVDSKNELVCYPCDQCAYKATKKRCLKKHIEAINVGVCYPWTNVNIKQHRQTISRLIYNHIIN